MQAWQIISSVLVLLLLGWSVYRERVVSRLLRQRRQAYRHGYAHGRHRTMRHYQHARRIELLNAARAADVRPDSGPGSHINAIRIQR